MRRRIVLASANSGKLREFAALADRLDFEFVPQAELVATTVAEPYATFVENALAKARHAAALTALPALADDSGLCVDALNGAPGVLSARFAGVPGNDELNNAELLRRLAGITRRDAHYTCVLVVVRAAGDPEPLLVDARWDGAIAHAECGAGGFGYDPLFYLPQLGVTAAELDLDHKNRLSHRGQAMRALSNRLASWRG